MIDGAEPRADTMRIAVIGTGAIALGSAAVLVDRGHGVTLWSPTGSTGPMAGSEITATGALKGNFPVQIAADAAAAVADADVILIAVTGNHHRAVMAAIAPLLHSPQAVLISSHCSFGAAFLASLLVARGVALPITAWGSTIVTGRRTAPLVVTIANIRKRIDVATLGEQTAGGGVALCRSLFGDRFQQRANIVAITLSNVNAQNHLAMALCNLTRIERGEAWGNYAGITPAVGRLMEALDGERLALAAAFNVSVRSVQQHFHLSFDVPLGSVAEMAAVIDARGPTPNGPTSLDTRYVLEDVPFGIVPIERLGRIAGVATPLHTAGIELFNALYGRDFRSDNDLLAALPPSVLTLASLTAQ
jgi:opine dehydrogenase